MTALLVSAVLAGLVGGLHCAAMCGGFAAAMVARDSHVLRPRGALVARQLTYHAGRIASYALLGALFGAAGESALAAAKVAPIQQALYVTANVLLLLLAFAIARRAAGGAWLARAGVGTFARVLPRVQPLLLRDGAGGRLTLGALWGFVPCTLVYGVLPLALFSGGAWQGALVMLVFGIGTLPHLVGAGFALSRIDLRRKGLRYAAALVIGAFAVVGLYRAMFMPEALGHGAFCLF
ncbi:MAG: sulfite exporter TauE/SafE family protein [Burkholderiales bacterium]